MDDMMLELSDMAHPSDIVTVLRGLCGAVICVGDHADIELSSHDTRRLSARLLSIAARVEATNG